MNGKKAKVLRGIARAKTTGYPNVAYNDYSPPQYQKIFVEGSLVPQIFKVAKGVPRTMKACTRKLYKKLKKVA